MLFRRRRVTSSLKRTLAPAIGIIFLILVFVIIVLLPAAPIVSSFIIIKHTSIPPKLQSSSNPITNHIKMTSSAKTAIPATDTTITTSAQNGDVNGRSSSWPTMGRPPADEPIEYLFRNNKNNDNNIDNNDGSKTIKSVPAVVNYVAPETTKVSTRRDLGGSDDTLIGAIWSPTVVRMNNARLGIVPWSSGGGGGGGGGEKTAQEKITLDKNGFELHTNLSKKDLSTIQSLDFCHQDQVVDEYYSICEKLVEESIMLSQQQQQQSSTTIAQKNIACICAFDHNVRSTNRASVGEIKASSNQSTSPGDEEESKHDENTSNVVTAVAAPQVQNPAGLVHADYTADSAPRRLYQLSQPPKSNDVMRHKLLSQNRSSLLDPTMVQKALDGKRRYAFINVWRSIDPVNPVRDTPLGCVDARTTRVDNLRLFQIHYVDRVGENYFVCPTGATGGEEDHGAKEWYYYPEMKMEEALLLKQWDSEGGIAGGADRDGDGTSTFTIHSAFYDPTCPEGAPPRKSIEVRCVVIWEE